MEQTHFLVQHQCKHSNAGSMSRWPMCTVFGLLRVNESTRAIIYCEYKPMIVEIIRKTILVHIFFWSQCIMTKCDNVQISVIAESDEIAICLFNPLKSRKCHQKMPSARDYYKEICLVHRPSMGIHGQPRVQQVPGPRGPGSSRSRVPAIRPGRPWPTQILAWTTQMNFWPTIAGGLPKVIVHIF